MTGSAVRPCTVVVEWTSSAFKAFGFDAGGVLLETRRAPVGMLAVTDRDFESALRRQIGDWLVAEPRVLLSGMITSRNGWVESPYAEAPADIGALMAGLVERRLAAGITLGFLPGVAVRSPVPDVMRGEEIQVLGAVGPGESRTVILPGAHSKWVRVEAGRIVDLRTFLTGETFALLRKHSIVGRLIPDDTGPVDADGFASGVRQAFETASGGLLNDAFTIRARTLLGMGEPSTMADRLSGVLVGHELKSGLALGWSDPEPPLLIGEPSVTLAYRTAFTAIGRVAVCEPADMASAGASKLARFT